MHELIISWPSGKKTFSPSDSPVTLGRSLESSVVVSDLTASRKHLTFAWNNDSWVAEDVSTHGSFNSAGVALDKQWTLTGDLKIRLGDPEGQDISITLSTSSETPLAPPLPPAAEEYQMTTVFDENNPLPEAAQPDIHAGQPVGDDFDRRFDDVLPPLPGEESAVPSISAEDVSPAAGFDGGDQVTNLQPSDSAVTKLESKPDDVSSLPITDGVPPMPSPPQSPDFGESAGKAPDSVTPPEPPAVPETPAPPIFGETPPALPETPEPPIFGETPPEPVETPALPETPEPPIFGETPPEPVEKPKPPIFGETPPEPVETPAVPETPEPPIFGDNAAESVDPTAPSTETNATTDNDDPLTQPTEPILNQTSPEPPIFGETPPEPVETPALPETPEPPIFGDTPPEPVETPALPETPQPPTFGDNAAELPETPALPETPQPPTFGENAAELPVEPTQPIDGEDFGGNPPNTEQAPAEVAEAQPFDPIAPPPIAEQTAPSATTNESQEEDSTILNDTPPPPPSSNGGQNPTPPTPATNQPPAAQPFVNSPTPDQSNEAPTAWNQPAQPPGPPASIQNVPPQPVTAGANPNPGGHWASQPSATVVQDNSLRVEVDGEHQVFQPHQEVTIGRDQNCTIVLDKRHSLASRQHVRITFRDGAWWMEDFSSKGTFVDGAQIKNPYQANGGFKALLGNKQAGTEVKIVAPGEHKINAKRRWPLFAAIAGAAVLLAFIIGIGVVATRGDDTAATTTVSPEQMEAAFLDQAKRSTVLIVSGDDQGVSTGSGFFVSETLIVTNQHVVDGDDLLEIAVSNGNDDPVELTYVGQILDRHPFLDIAVVQLTGELIPAATPADEDPGLSAPGFSIGPLQSGNDSSVEVGSSDGLVLGTTVFSTGFPGSFNTIGANNEGGLQLPPVGTDSGGASSFAIWPGCNNPTAEAAIPQGSPTGVQCNEAGDVKNAVVTTSFTSGPGASGSPVYQDGKVIAVVFAGAAGEAETNSGRSITSSSFKDWLDPIIAAN